MAPSERDRKLEGIEWTVALLATGVAVLLSVTAFRNAGALWRDEVNSVHVALAPSFSELWRRMEFESFPLLWILLLRGWLAVNGASEDAGLRLLGLLGGLAVPAAIWFAALRLGRRAPLASLALLAVNPEVVRWSTSVRAWGLGTALAIVTLVVVGEATMAPSRRRVLCAGVIAVLSVQCVFQNAVLLAATVAGGMAVAVAERRWRRALVPFGIGLVAAASLLPYAPTLGRVATWSMLNQAAISVGLLGERAGAVLAASGGIVLACWSVFLGVGLAAGGWRLVSPRIDVRSDVVLFAVVAASAAVGGLAVFLLHLGYRTQPWYFVGLLAFAAACIEAVIATCSRARAPRIATVCLALVALAAGFPEAVKVLRERRTNVDVVAARLETEAVRGDLIVVNPWYLAVSFGRYYRGDADVTTIPPLEEHRVHRYDLLKQRMLSDDPIGLLLERIERVLRAGRRVWIVGELSTPRETRVPRSLPTPPLPDTAWGSEPYVQLWALQTGALLAKRALEIDSVPIEVSGGFYENAELMVVRGWRE